MKLNWGNSIFLFLTVFVLMGIAFIVFSLSKNNDLVTTDYYQKGADYTKQMVITGRSAVYNDSIRVINQNNDVVVRFAHSINLMTDTMQVYFYRPSDKKLDFNYQGLLNTDSLIIKKEYLSGGRYKVKFQWLYNRESYQIEKEFFIE
ncbi:MAG TPA: FixH family protein [Prolixibacteraceae bacterium]|nr:FixH family protein [Prolixibacteraceae bacterium]